MLENYCYTNISSNVKIDKIHNNFFHQNSYIKNVILKIINILKIDIQN